MSFFKELWKFIEDKMLARSFLGFVVATIMYWRIEKFPWYAWIICFGLFLSFQATLKIINKYLDKK